MKKITNAVVGILRVMVNSIIRKLYKELVPFSFDLNRHMSTQAIIAEMGKVGQKPATIWSLIILNIYVWSLPLYDKRRFLQKGFRKYPIVALGSVFGKAGRVAFLRQYSSGRGLGLTQFERDWSGYYQFAVVRK